MANINFGLLDTQYPEKLANAFVRTPEQQNANMLQAMQMQQLMDQREQAQYALGKSRREETGLAAFGAGLKALGPDPSPDAVAQLFMAHPSPEMQKAGLGMLQEARASAAYGKLAPMGGATTAPAAAPASPFTANMMANRAALPTFGDNQLAATAGATPASAPAATRESQIAQLEARLTQVSPLARYSPEAKAEQARITDRIKELSKPQVLAQGGTFIPGPGLAPITAPEATSQDIRTMQALGYPNTQAGYTAFRDAQRQDRLLTPAEEEQRIRIAGASRAPAQPRPEQPLERVVDPATGKIIFVSREEALRNRMTPANTVEKPMTQAQRVKYAKDKVSDKDVVTGALAVTGELEKLTDELVGNPDKKIAPAPGLNSITGYSALTNPLALPSGNARKALQKLETFKGKIMALGRQLASQEGKLGNMAVQEWKFVSDAVQKIDPAAGNLDAQMRDVVRQSKEYALRQQSKYDDTYADDLTAPPAGATNAPGQWGKAVAE